MKIKQWRIIIIAGLYSLMGMQASGENCIANITSYPPFAILENEQELYTESSGIVIDVLDLFQKEYPTYKIEYINYPVARGRRMEEIGTKGFDIAMGSPLFKNKTIFKHFEFTSSIVRTKDIIITKKESTLIYKTPKDLYGTTVGVLFGYGYAEFDSLFDAGKIKAEYVSTHIQNIKKLNLGRIDAYWGNSHVSPYFIKQMGLNPNDYRYSETTLFEFDYGPFVTKRKPKLHEDLTQFLEKIKRTGNLEAIIAKYTKNK